MPPILAEHEVLEVTRVSPVSKWPTGTSCNAAETMHNVFV